MLIVRRLHRQHNSIVVAIPPGIAILTDLHAGDYVTLSTQPPQDVVQIERLYVMKDQPHGHTRPTHPPD